MNTTNTPEALTPGQATFNEDFPHGDWMSLRPVAKRAWAEKESRIISAFLATIKGPTVEQVDGLLGHPPLTAQDVIDFFARFQAAALQRLETERDGFALESKGRAEIIAQQAAALAELRGRIESQAAALDAEHASSESLKRERDEARRNEGIIKGFNDGLSKAVAELKQETAALREQEALKTKTCPECEGEGRIEVSPGSYRKCDCRLYVKPAPSPAAVGPICHDCGHPLSDPTHDRCSAP